MDSQKQKVTPVASITSYADMGFVSCGVVENVESRIRRFHQSPEEPNAQNYYLRKI